MRYTLWPSLVACLLFALPSGCAGPRMEASAVARLRVRPSAADVRAWLGEPRHRGEGSKPYWIYRWRAPRAAEGCQLLVAFDPYSGRVTAYQVNRYARSRVF